MSPSPETRILFVGDLHLGRLPGHVHRDLDAGILGPAAALESVCELAVERRVQAVAFAGDLVDAENAAFEAYGALERGLARLLGAGIAVCAVAGNHDTRTLPRLAEVLGDGFRQLGPGGTWSSHTVSAQGGPPVRLAGWSFPARHHDASPPLDLAPPPQPGLVTIGLLHGDLDATGSRYAPVSARALREVGYQAWCLGHVHRPDPVPADGSPFFLGSVTALDPGETGARGPVLAAIDTDGVVRMERIAVGPLRWEKLALPCPEPGQPLEPALLAGILEHARGLGPELDGLRALGYRLELTGRVASPAAVDRALKTLDPERLITDHGGVRLFVDKVTGAVTADVDLARLAGQTDPIGLLARQILALEDPSPRSGSGIDADDLAADLLREAEAVAGEVAGHPHFARLGDETARQDQDSLRAMLIETGRLALDGLLQDRGGDDAPA